MRHGRHTAKFNRTAGHRRCMLANQLKELILRGRIVTTLPKAKELRRHADRVVTMAKRGTLASRRRASALMMVRRNPLTPKERRLEKAGNGAVRNGDHRVLNILFDDLGPRFANRPGGYTRILRLGEFRTGDGVERCLIEYLSE